MSIAHWTSGWRSGCTDFEDDGKGLADEVEPSVPAGPRRLSDSLASVAKFLGIDDGNDWARLGKRTPLGDPRGALEKVKRESFVHVAYQRNADRLVADLAHRNTAAAMRAYADEFAAHAAELEASDAQAARE